MRQFYKIALLALFATACVKKQIPQKILTQIDPREAVVGNYTGYWYSWSWNGSSNVYSSVLPLQFTITKSQNNDSVVYFSYNGGSQYSYKYSANTFTVTGFNYHPPILTLGSDDTLRFSHAPALGPYIVYGRGRK